MAQRHCHSSLEEFLACQFEFNLREGGLTGTGLINIELINQ